MLPQRVTRVLGGRLPSPVLSLLEGLWGSLWRRACLLLRMALPRAPRLMRNGVSRVGASRACGGGAFPSAFPAAHGFPSPDGEGCPVPAPAQLPCVTRARSDTQGFIVMVTRGPGPRLFLSILV